MRALVTGATGFVGAAVARALLHEGWQVRALVRSGADRTNLHSLALEIAVGDLTERSSLDRATAGCEALFRQLPQVDVLVNNLGIFEPQAFAAITDADWLRFFEVNVLSGVRLSRQYLPGMRERTIFLHGLYLDVGLCPLTGIVQQIPQHLFQIFALPANEMSGRNIHVDRKPASSVDFLQGSRQPFHRNQDGTAGTRQVAGSSRASLRQMIVNLPTHAINLQADRGCGFVLACSLELFGLLGQHRQRRFQSMREIAGFCQCPPDDLLTVF